MRRESGFTLIEILIVMAIAMIVLGGIFASLISQDKSYNVQTRVTEMHQNVRIALNLIARDVRMAGYVGCYASQVYNNLVGSAQDDYTSDPIKGINNDADATDTIMDGSDYIYVKVVSNSEYLGVVTPYPASATADLDVNDIFSILELNGGTVKAGTLMIACDCDEATIFKITNVAPSGSNFSLSHAVTGADFDDNSTNDLQHVYREHTRVYPWYRTKYYLNTSGTILRKVNDAVPQPIAENIEDLQFQYGIDTDDDNNVDSWVNAGDPGYTPGDIKSIRIIVLGRTSMSDPTFSDTHDDNTGLAGKQYILADHTITLDESDANGTNSQYDYRFRRRSMYTTVTVRNMAM